MLGRCGRDTCPIQAGDLLLSVIERLTLGGIDLGHRFVNVAVVRAHNSSFLGFATRHVLPRFDEA